MQWAEYEFVWNICKTISLSEATQKKFRPKAAETSTFLKLAQKNFLTYFMILIYLDKFRKIKLACPKNQMQL